MLKKKVQKIMRIAALILLIILAIRIIFIDSVIVAYRGAIYVEDYNEFYLYKKEKNMRPFIDFGEGGASGYKVWFLIGQKDKLLKKMREDINNGLAELIAQNSKVFMRYEIKDEYKKIYIYYYKNAKFPANLDVGKTIESRVELYHEFIHGYTRTSFDGNIVNFVEVE